MVVIVEDKKDVRLLLVEYFSFFKKDVLSYASAEDAIHDIEHLKACNISVIISDYSLPGLNGIDFIEYVKEQLGSPLCMLVSGHFPRNIPKDIVVVAKPFLPSVLFKTMNDHLERLANVS